MKCEKPIWANRQLLPHTNSPTAHGGEKINPVMMRGLVLAIFASFLSATASAQFTGSSDASPDSRPMTSPNGETRNSNIPLYQTLRPMWGLEISGGAAFPRGEFASFALAGFSGRFQWQPPWIQAAGVFGIGLSLDYTMGVMGGAVGGVVSYQARYFRNQPLVPYAGYALMYASAISTTGGFSLTGGSLVQGPYFGGMILLNFFEGDAAADFYVNIGVLRSYLVAEARMFQGYTSTFPTLGTFTYYAGLRFEF